MTFTPENGGAPETRTVYDYKGPGVGLAMYNTDESIIGFAHSSFKMALTKKLPLYFVNQKHYFEEIRWKIQRHFP